MSTHRKPSIRLVLQATILFTPLASIAQETDRQVIWPTSVAVQTETGQQIPAGAYGIVQIQTPRVANLLQLRGVIGRGTAILRSDDNQDCQSMQLRFVAGDFGGDSVSTHTAQPIRLILQSERVSKALARGEDVVSDIYVISSQINDPDADIIIEGGLSENHGFVLNPGTSIVADVFGAATSRLTCSEM
ncbi:hypothetical protein [Stappia sp. BW2]|uniref:hypothetical protein n=1 Tax=Stappia sp. BW2 TaxID=2592622 RepID=UPI001AD91341|nr:hypothetical protein [Stappia sp. BW2]